MNKLPENINSETLELLKALDLDKEYNLSDEEQELVEILLNVCENIKDEFEGESARTILKVALNVVDEEELLENNGFDEDDITDDVFDVTYRNILILEIV